MKKRIFKLFSIVMVLAMLMTIAPFTVATTAAGNYDYTIVNPYETVNWDTWKQYKANLHTHTIASDGNNNIDEMVEYHYELGYDILALTDHGTVSAPWNKAPQQIPLAKWIKADRNKGREMQPLTDARYQEILTGADRGGRGMLDVPFSIELNAGVPSNNHINSFFVNYGQGLVGVDGDYKTPISNVDRLGGLTIINHPGEYTGGRRDKKQSSNPRYIKKYSEIFMLYDSCLGFDINSKGDDRTQNDRILWDECLKLLVPNGRVIWGFATSDAHNLGVVDKNFTMMIMPSNTVENLRTSMENGAFFAVGRNAYAELGPDFRGEGPVPEISRIAVDQVANTISITGANFDTVKWVSDGEVIATGATIDLNDYQDKLGSYVRAYATGTGGIIYTQPFAISCPEAPVEAKEIKYGMDYSDVLRKIGNIISELCAENKIYTSLRKFLVGR